MMFIILRDGTEYIQVGVFGESSKQFKEIVCVESFIKVRGLVKEDKRSPYGYEISAEELNLIGKSSSEYEAEVSPSNGVFHKMNVKHLLHRGENCLSIFKVRDFLLHTIRNYYFDNDFVEVTPPSIVSTSCEGGSTLFKLNYYDTEAYLTQSSQLYLETVVPAHGNVYCIHPSFRAEKSQTRRHLSEYTHIEGELMDMTLEKLIEHLWSFFSHIFSCLEQTPHIWEYIQKLNLGFTFPKEYKVINYSEIIQFCKDNDI